MRAVNLIPPDLRRGSSSIGRSGGAVYVLLGALGGLMILAALYAVANHQIADRKAKLVQANRDSAAAQARARQLAPYQQFASLKTQREEAVASLASTRFDWPGAMRNIASALPADVTLSTFAATLGQAGSSGPAPAASAGAGAGAGTGTPNVHLAGCATSHTEVGNVIDRMRGVPGVASVTFASSSKGGTNAGASTGSASTTPGACVGPQFDITVFFNLAGASGSAGQPGSAQPTGTSAPSSAATPASSSTAPPASAVSSTPAGAHP